MNSRARKIFAILIVTIILVSIASVVLLSTGILDEGGLKKIFVNTKNEKISVIFSTDFDIAVLDYPDKSMVGIILKKEESESGFQYVKDAYEIIGKGNEIVVKANGEVVFQGYAVEEGMSGEDIARTFVVKSDWYKGRGFDLRLIGTYSGPKLCDDCFTYIYEFNTRSQDERHEVKIKVEKGVPSLLGELESLPGSMHSSVQN